MRRLAVSLMLVLVASTSLAQTSSSTSGTLAIESSSAKGAFGDASIGGEGLVRAQLVASNGATLAAELDARIVKLALRDGEVFTKGEVLVSFDCRRHQAELGKVRALAQAKSSAHTVLQRLVKLNAASEFELAKAAAELRAARAEIAVVQATVSRCQIKAPYNGRVTAREARQHEYVSAGQPLLTIYDATNLEAELIVPSRWLGWIKPGVAFQLLLDETGSTYTARVLRIGGSVDAVSQSVKLYAQVDNVKDALLPGMSGTARFQPPQ